MRQLREAWRDCGHVAGHAAIGELSEDELLDRLAGGVDGHRLERACRFGVGVEPVAVAQVVARRQHDGLAVVVGDAAGLAEADVVSGAQAR